MTQQQYQLEDYELFIYSPDTAPPSAGFPVLYVLDGNAFFHTVSDLIHLQSRRQEKTGVIPAIVCAVGYPGDAPFHPRRFWDYTPPQDTLHAPKRPNGQPWPASGGADQFLRTMEKVVKPFVEAHYPVNRLSQTLFGHSLGGLLTLYALYTKPDAYQHYVAISPSLWWNRSLMRGLEHDYLIQPVDNHHRVFMAVGSEEKNYLIQDAAELFARLHDSDKIQVEFMEAAGENHLSVVPTVMSRALRFVNREDG